MEGQFEVSASWMQACGKGQEAKTFPVRSTYMSGHLPFAVLEDGTVAGWVVNAEWRGRFV